MSEIDRESKSTHSAPFTYSSSTISNIGKPERATQNRVIALFHDELKYRFLGEWSDRPDNSNIEEGLLSGYLIQAGYSREQINRTLHLLRIEADNPSRSLYDNNKAVYSLLRYGVDVQTQAGQAFQKRIDSKRMTPERAVKKDGRGGG